MWINKYKPRRVADVIMCDNVKSKIENFVSKGDIPNIIISGSIGIGKSSLLDCIARDVFGNECPVYVRRLNSSLDATTTQFREMLESFCKKKVDDIGKKKMIIIDDIDNIPEKNQLIVALTMENYQNVQYAFSCSNASDILESIQSRCVMLQILRPTQTQLMAHLEIICRNEHCSCTPGALKRLCFISQGDIRQSINYLQTVCDSFGGVTTENLENICDMPNIVILGDILDMCVAGQKKEAILKAIAICRDGFNCSDILGGMFELLRDPSCEISNDIKMKLLTQICKMRYIVSKKIDSVLQLETCIIGMCDSISDVS